MDNSSIYGRTGKGTAELMGGTGKLSESHLRILGMVDGSLNIAALASGRNAGPGLMQALAELEKMGLIQLSNTASSSRVARLPIPTIEVIELSPTESVQAWAEAKRGARELEEKGFFTPDGTLHHASAGSQKRGVHVLVVEDDATTARILEFLLTQHGFPVIKAADSVAAFAHLEQPVLPDVVLLDVMLPGKNGFDILKQIRGDGRLQQLPVIMVTSQISDDYVMRGLKEGADGYVFKPLKWETLHACIEKLI
jgi:CheY-like chemotaxis protein